MKTNQLFRFWLAGCVLAILPTKWNLAQQFEKCFQVRYNSHIHHAVQSGPDSYIAGIWAIQEFESTPHIMKFDSLGNQVWSTTIGYKHRIRAMLPSGDGGAILLLEDAFLCDVIIYNFYLQKINASGTLLSRDTLSTAVQGRSESIRLDSNRFLISINQFLYLFDSIASPIDTFSYSNSHIHDLALTTDQNWLISTAERLVLTDSGGQVMQFRNVSRPIQHAIPINDSSYLMVQDRTLSRLDVNFGTIDTFRIPPALGLVRDVAETDSGIYVLTDKYVGKVSSQWLFEPVFAVNIPSNNIPQQFLPAENGLVISGIQYQDSFPDWLALEMRTYSQSFFKTYSLLGQSDFLYPDLSIDSVIFDSEEFEKYYPFWANDEWRPAVRRTIRLRLKNTGQVPIDQVSINSGSCSFTYNCFGTYSSVAPLVKAFQFSPLMPGQTTDIVFENCLQLILYNSTLAQYDTIQKFCIDVSVPNHRIDADPTNDRWCRTLDITHLLTHSEPRQDISLSIFPNPTSHHLRIRSGSPIERLILRDLKGRILIEKAVARQTESTLSLLDLPKGLYLLAIESEAGRLFRRIVRD
ncbi:MAG: T9SS type A sorting domain-containing protein [Bacteroidota bacterium]